MNQTLKTALLLSALTALLVVVGYLLAGQSGAIVFLLISFVMNFFSFWFSDKIALASAGAQELSEASAPEIHADVAEIANKMGIPKPRVYVINSQQPNAFATGRGPSNSAVALTGGITKMLDRDELRGVIAHELGHIKNRDVLTSTIAATIAGAISSIANIALWFGGDDDNANPLTALLVAIFAPLGATIVQLAISRSREFDADAAAAHYTGQPRSLASALIKIEEYSRAIPMNVNPAYSSLYIQNPLGGQSIARLFSTHPPTAERVARLEQMV